MSRIKGKEAGLAVIIAGIGIGVAIFADNIISERAYIKAQTEKAKVMNRAIDDTSPTPAKEKDEEIKKEEEEDEEEEQKELIQAFEDEKEEMKTTQVFSDEEEEEEEDTCHDIIGQPPPQSFEEPSSQGTPEYKEYLKDWFNDEKKA